MAFKRTLTLLVLGVSLGGYLFYHSRSIAMAKAEEHNMGSVIIEEPKTTPVEPKKVKIPAPVYEDYIATAYCGCRKCNGKWTGYPTASGTKMVQGRTIAVDPRDIPLGSKVSIEGMGEYVAEDTGSAIKGNRVDIYFDSHKEALEFGRQRIKLRVLRGEDI